MEPRWIADRMRSIDVSGVRRVFNLARDLKDPINLSIGQPHFAVPAPIQQAAIRAIERGFNGYTVTQGIAELHGRLRADLDRRYGHADREVMVTSGTSGGLLLALTATINPGDEVILFDPYFVSYPHLVTLAGGVSVVLDTYPDFRIDPDRVGAALTPRTKAIVVNSPANPSGVVATAEVLRDLARLAREHGVLLISDEIYHAYCYDQPFASPAEFDEDVLVVDGFGKTYGITGWRMGFAHGPRAILEAMGRLQQCSYVCAPSMAQHAGVAALDYDVTPIVADYRRKRDRLLEALRGSYEVAVPGGAFYLFPKVPWGTGVEFVSEAIRNHLLIIPGSTFSRRDTHFRVSYAAEDATLDRGAEVLGRIARGPVVA